MILIGIDDTDIANSRGTNQLARAIVRRVGPRWRCKRIVRHQLLFDPRVPFTSKNGSASIALEWDPHQREAADPAACDAANHRALLETCRRVMRDDFIPGSDPGLSFLAGECPPAVIEWGRRCQCEVVSRDEARAVAEQAGVHLEALGGTEDGVIGALAAVGLAAAENDGRIVQLGQWPDDLSGRQDVSHLHRRGVRICTYASHHEVTSGAVDVGKHLRPNLREGTAVLFVERERNAPGELYRAIKLP